MTRLRRTVSPNRNGMHPQDRERLRRALEAALESLTGETLDSPSTAVSSSIALPEDPRPEGSKSCGCEHGVRLHPGLERFPLSEPGSGDPSLRSCFIEPDRACVGSGACEMRGY